MTPEAEYSEHCYCGKKALRRVGKIGYCREHYDEAVKASKAEKRGVQSEHGLRTWQWKAEHGRRT